MKINMSYNILLTFIYIHGHQSFHQITLRPVVQTQNYYQYSPWFLAFPQSHTQSTISSNTKYILYFPTSPQFPGPCSSLSQNHLSPGPLQ